VQSADGRKATRTKGMPISPEPHARIRLAEDALVGGPTRRGDHAEGGDQHRDRAMGSLLRANVTPALHEKAVATPVQSRTSYTKIVTEPQWTWATVICLNRNASNRIQKRIDG
jgi:hypothetical protein